MSVSLRRGEECLCYIKRLYVCLCCKEKGLSGLVPLCEAKSSYGSVEGYYKNYDIALNQISISLYIYFPLFLV